MLNKQISFSKAVGSTNAHLSWKRKNRCCLSQLGGGPCSAWTPKGFLPFSQTPVSGASRTCRYENIGNKIG
ncbi:hypothetical protein chiPu_0010445 [Chiloscyllium punctatum]|uniref:Uncharacterized protein n=1 Tax=Chiloscyllium punctatum TaxID=137246 RepID=A0A401SNL0_CHIPU|nr:hypothetical protein [Chiloscyllium punctatum]